MRKYHDVQEHEQTTAAQEHIELLIHKATGFGQKQGTLLLYRDPGREKMHLKSSTTAGGRGRQQVIDGGVGDCAELGTAASGTTASRGRRRRGWQRVGDGGVGDGSESGTAALWTEASRGWWRRGRQRVGEAGYFMEKQGGDSLGCREGERERTGEWGAHRRRRIPSRQIEEVRRVGFGCPSLQRQGY